MPRNARTWSFATFSPPPRFVPDVGGGTRAALLLIKRGYFVEEVANARCSGVNSLRFSARIIHMNPHQSETISPLEGTTSSCDELTVDFGVGPEVISIGDPRLFCLIAENQSGGV
jgi:hypothetical protein